MTTQPKCGGGVEGVEFRQIGDSYQSVPCVVRCSNEVVAFTGVGTPLCKEHAARYNAELQPAIAG